MAKEVRVPLTEAQRAQVKGTTKPTGGTERDFGSSPEQKDLRAQDTMAQMDLRAQDTSVQQEDLSADLQSVDTNIDSNDLSADLQSVDTNIDSNDLSSQGGDDVS
ncbi:MAG TPA: hypothetical protein VKG01_06240 [Thermoanaerobaculia bacterium]|nr:hypothetical protein [Thermoanaerobaculia bacterium]